MIGVDEIIDRVASRDSLDEATGPHPNKNMNSFLDHHHEANGDDR